MTATCVQDRIDSFVVRTTPFTSCIHRLHCVTPHDLTSDCALRCYWEAVGGGHYPSEIDGQALMAVFEDAFEPEAEGGCRQVGM